MNIFFATFLLRLCSMELFHNLFQHPVHKATVNESQSNFFPIAPQCNNCQQSRKERKGENSFGHQVKKTFFPFLVVYHFHGVPFSKKLSMIDSPPLTSDCFQIVWQFNNIGTSQEKNDYFLRRRCRRRRQRRRWRRRQQQRTALVFLGRNLDGKSLLGKNVRFVLFTFQLFGARLSELKLL